jgi:hypothetical protein
MLEKRLNRDRPGSNRAVDLCARMDEHFGWNDSMLENLLGQSAIGIAGCHNFRCN